MTVPQSAIVADFIKSVYDKKGVLDQFVENRLGLYLLIADVTVQSHSGHPTRGCIPRC